MIELLFGEKGFLMAIKELVAKVGGWWGGRGNGKDVCAQIDEDGLICEDGEVSSGQESQHRHEDGDQVNEIVVKKPDGGTIEKKESIEKLGEAFNCLVDQLQGINDHLGRQVQQHEALMGRIDQLPDLLEALPGAVDTQKQVVESLVEQLKGKALKDQQFADVVGKIPVETIKQTNALVDMNQKLSVSTEISSQMSDNFNRFGSTLEKLDSSTASQTESIVAMGKTFAASDRYLKYIISKQNKRFMWIFVTSLGISVFAIVALIVAVVIIFNR